MAISAPKQILGLFLIASMNPTGLYFPKLGRKFGSVMDLKKLPVHRTFLEFIKREQFDLYLEKFIKPIGKLPEPISNKAYYEQWFKIIGRSRNVFDLMFCSMNYNFNIMDDLKQIKCPVKIIYGNDDNL